MAESKKGYTLVVATGPLDDLPDELGDLLATALERTKLQGVVVTADLLSRTLSIRASLDAVGPADAIFLAVGELTKGLSRVKLVDLGDAEIVEISILRELPENEFMSARDDIVGTPDVAARLGVSRQRVAQLVDQKGRFPTPVATVRGTHVWRWGDIADWIAAGARDMRRKKAG